MPSGRTRGWRCWCGSAPETRSRDPQGRGARGARVRNAFDYYRADVHVDGVKLHEGAATKAAIESVYRKALG